MVLVLGRISGAIPRISVSWTHHIDAPIQHNDMLSARVLSRDDTGHSRRTFFGLNVRKTFLRRHFLLPSCPFGGLVHKRVGCISHLFLPLSRPPAEVRRVGDAGSSDRQRHVVSGARRDVRGEKGKCAATAAAAL